MKYDDALAQFIEVDIHNRVYHGQILDQLVCTYQTLT